MPHRKTGLLLYVCSQLNFVKFYSSDFYILKTWVTLPHHSSTLHSCRLHKVLGFIVTLAFNELGAYLMPISLSWLPPSSTVLIAPCPFAISCPVSYTYERKQTHNCCMCESCSIHFPTNNVIAFLFMNEWNCWIYRPHFLSLSGPSSVMCTQDASVFWPL